MHPVRHAPPLDTLLTKEGFRRLSMCRVESMETVGTYDILILVSQMFPAGSDWAQLRITLRKAKDSSRRYGYPNYTLYCRAGLPDSGRGAGPSIPVGKISEELAHQLLSGENFRDLNYPFETWEKAVQDSIDSLPKGLKIEAQATSW